MRTKSSELIVDDNNISILVEYWVEKPNFETELISVELIIADRGINILQLLHPNEKEKIIELLTYE